MSWAEEHRLRALESKVRALEDALATIQLKLEGAPLPPDSDVQGVREVVRKRREMNDEQRAALRDRLAAGRAKAAAERAQFTVAGVVIQQDALSYEEDVGELPSEETALPHGATP